METTGLIRLLYTFFLGVLLAVFVGVGINTFYPGPQAPTYPAALNTYGKEMTAQQQTVQRAYDLKMQRYNEKMKPYNRNVSIVALICALVLLTISIVFEKRIQTISEGVMLGGLFTLIYSIGRGFASGDSKYMFITVTIGLIVVLYLGFRRFVQPRTTPTKS